MSKKLKPEDFRYAVTQTFEKANKYFTITKKYRNAIKETYEVELDPDDEDRVWCNCPGFIMQKYPKPLHKHVMLAKDYVARGRPLVAVYKLQAKTNKVIFIK